MFAKSSTLSTVSGQSCINPSIGRRLPFDFCPYCFCADCKRLLTLRIEPRFGPCRGRHFARKYEPVVQPERAVAPELERQGNQAVAAPVRRTRHIAQPILQREL